MKILIIYILLAGLLFAQDNTFRSTDASGPMSPNQIIKLESPMCSVKFNGIAGVYTNLSRESEDHISCQQLSSLFANFIINKYSPTKIKNNNAGTIYFGIKDLGQCNVALELDDGKLVGTPYGDEGVCARVSSHNN